ncbi:deoxyribose-phosphate aldolase [Aquimarina sp. AU474]|uniref:deoxyribose-phosphate aldolase n=1 Tax=Aquimarina sp. AU474 TaxID=2108529 RepID=UPI000D699E13|nr:deoxyribose-phosphate aldolase [Aquimarina sp. AU474]
MQLNRYIDHTLLKANTTVGDIKKLCSEAKKYNFYAVCVSSYYVTLAKTELRNRDVQVASVIGFPLGSTSSAIKVFEANECVNQGADEIDMVLNIGLLKSGYHNIVEDEIKSVKKTIENKILKVIFENCYLTDEEKKIACKLSINAGADYIKTSTGFGSTGATVEDVILMKKEVGNSLKIKASGGIRNIETAKKFIDLGVSRIGTSSGIHIVSH